MQIGVARFEAGRIELDVVELDVRQWSVAEVSTSTSNLAQIRETCDLEIPKSVPNACTRSSTKRVETPST